MRRAPSVRSRAEVDRLGGRRARLARRLHFARQCLFRPVGQVAERRVRIGERLGRRRFAASRRLSAWLGVEAESPHDLVFDRIGIRPWDLRGRKPGAGIGAAVRTRGPCSTIVGGGRRRRAERLGRPGIGRCRQWRTGGGRGRQWRAADGRDITAVRLGIGRKRTLRRCAYRLLGLRLRRRAGTVAGRQRARRCGSRPRLRGRPRRRPLLRLDFWNRRERRLRKHGARLRWPGGRRGALFLHRLCRRGAFLALQPRHLDSRRPRPAELLYVVLHDEVGRPPS
jgi:hypothetical protein